jgi:hypothetical protein
VSVGEEALAPGDSDDKIIRSPKISVLRNQEPADEDEGEPTEEALASALIIAEAIRQARRCIDARAGGRHRDLLFNLDVPVRDLDSHGAAPVFRRVLTAGIHFSTCLPSRPVWERAVEAWKDAARAEDELGDLIPEAQAVMQGISLLGRLPPDSLHAVLDVGAGTIDIGIFKLVSVMDGDRMPFWGADTHAIGCDQLDECLCHTAGVDLRLLEQVRVAKTRLVAGETEFSVDGRSVTQDALTSAAHWLAGDCWPTYREVFGQAYGKQKNADEWATLSAVVVGGGSLVVPLRDRLLRPPRDVVKFVRAVDLAGRLRCEVVGASDRPPTTAELPFPIPAVGLAHVKPEMARFVPPSAVEDDPGRERRATGIYDYEIGDT